MKSILITGGSGFLGGMLLNLAASRWTTYGTYFSSFCEGGYRFYGIYLDIRNKEDVEQIICQLTPDVIIHAAAITNFNFCANNKKLAWDINVNGTQNVVSAAEHIKSKVIFISSDLVFNGEQGFCSEDDIPNPQSFYGRTKYEGEKVVSLLSSNYLIIRTSVIYGWSYNSSKCFAENIINSLNSGEKVQLFVDEFRNPIYGPNLCNIILDFAENNIKNEIFHICGNERMNRYDFGIKISEIFGFSKENIIPISVEEFLFEDKRPKDCSMKNNKVLSYLKDEIISLDEGLEEMRKNYGGYK